VFRTAIAAQHMQYNAYLQEPFATGRAADGSIITCIIFHRSEIVTAI
jgi:hypothetical protein